LVRYLFTGGAAVVVDIGGFQLLSLARIPVVVAASSSFALATAVNFLLTARWVFRIRANAWRYVLFLLGAALGGLVNVILTTVGVTYLEFPGVLAKTVGIGLTFLLNFWINAAVVFRPYSTSK